MLPGKADRYTVRFQVAAAGIPDIMLACKTLGLSWFALQSEDAPLACDVYIFFDRQGMKNYMLGLYAPKED